MTSQLENIVSPMRGKLVIGEHDSIILLGAKSQNEIKECSKSLSKILLESTIDLDITIADVVRKIECFCDDTSGKFNSFLFSQKREQKMLHKRYAEAVSLLDSVSLYFKLQQAQLLKEIKMLEYISENIAESKKELSSCIEEANEKLTLRGSVVTTQNPATSLLEPEQNTNQWFVRLERRLLDLKMSYTVSLQNEEQIKLLRNNNQVLLDKISSAITNTIPLWQTQMSLALGVELMENRINVQEKVLRITDAHLSKAKKVKSSRKKGKINSIDIEKVLSLNHRLNQTLLDLEKVEKDDEEIRNYLKNSVKKGSY